MQEVLLHIYSSSYTLVKINTEEGHLPPSSNSLMSFKTAATLVLFFFALQPSLLLLPLRKGVGNICALCPLLIYCCCL